MWGLWGTWGRPRLVLQLVSITVRLTLNVQWAKAAWWGMGREESAPYDLHCVVRVGQLGMSPSR